MILFNLTATAQPVLDLNGIGHTIPAHGSADLPEADAQLLAREVPERFSLQDPSAKPVTKKSKKES